MEKRKFGSTGLEASLLGFGGFHLVEIPYHQADLLLNTYLDKGGNYIETAASYGNGESEMKIGKAISHRRNEYTLVTKSEKRDYESCMAEINQSIKNLRTDYVDVLLMHAVATFEDLDRILSEKGAIKAAEQAKKEGKVKHIGISMHGQPDVLIESLKRYDFEAVMTTINYFDVCNFPKIKSELLPLANEKGIAVILMKPIGDGFLWKSPKDAFKYAFSQSVSVVVTGMNTMELLETDFELAKNYIPMTKEEEEDIFKNAIELGDYVCRQCKTCMTCPEGIDIPKIFRLEGMFDRQMSDGYFDNVAEYALQERLKHWFQGNDRAKREYKALKVDVKACTECGACMKCPYGIDIIQKLKNVDYKLDDQYDKIFE